MSGIEATTTWLTPLPASVVNAASARLRKAATDVISASVLVQASLAPIRMVTSPVPFATLPA